eukprot:gnl/TRDRNA2_/TRDRNA2_92472_c0_seq1.p1 gnl/TRDRNA2_/TRDRNA2_92472_c0~~gnl/TRDRNA2_/TRDRNA2_92472_c0_seq1.p1  ORF type:complete len:391 (-),score=88.43 gnl/TRDRNA2_/TRDRNA2_92472_c0_seq1:35-1207(-)
MGACLTAKRIPAGESPEGAEERQRRRLTILKPGDEAPAKEEVKDDAAARVRARAKAQKNIFDFFPEAKRRGLCTRSCACETNQKGFADKEAARDWPDGKKDSASLAEFCVGYACKKGLKPESPNQDDFYILRVEGTGIYGVFDGHGPYGHDVSNFVHEELPRCFIEDTRFRKEPEQALSAAFPKSHDLVQQIGKDLHFDCGLSGTTATLVMHRDDCLYCGHVGDSRTVVARGDPGRRLIAEDLTEDHKPSSESECRRIKEAGGSVRRIEGDIQYRVFVAGKMYPGLSMTRSIGDTAAADAGVCSTPDVKKVKVESDFRFVLVCTDGIWEFITSQEAVDIVAKFAPSEVQRAAEELASEAWRRWIQEEGNIVDDITVICFWLSPGKGPRQP